MHTLCSASTLILAVTCAGKACTSCYILLLALAAKQACFGLPLDGLDLAGLMEMSATGASPLSSEGPQMSAAHAHSKSSLRPPRFKLQAVFRLTATATEPELTLQVYLGDSCIMHMYCLNRSAVATVYDVRKNSQSYVET